MDGLDLPSNRADVDPREFLRNNSQRLSAARFVLVVLMVWIHIPLHVWNAAEGRDALTVAYFANATVLRFSVSMLTLISGYIFFATQGEANPVRSIRRKIPSLVVPFLVWNLSLVLVVWLAQSQGLFGGFRLYLPTANVKTWFDALFAATAQPVNYPLYFLRDLFVIFVIASITGRAFRRHLFPGLLIVLAVYQYELDGLLVLRNDMLLSFFVGGAAAVARVNPNGMDRYAVPLLSLLLSVCVVHFATRGVDVSNESLLALRFIGIASAWPALSLFVGTRAEATFAKLGRYAFPVFLIHGPILALLLALGIHIPAGLPGLLLWLASSPVIVLTSIALFRVLTWIAPRVTAVTTGGRGA